MSLAISSESNNLAQVLVGDSSYEITAPPSARRSPALFRNAEERNTYKLEKHAQTEHWPTIKTKGILGTINHLLHCLASDIGAVVRNDDGQLIACDRKVLLKWWEGPLKIVSCAVQGTAEYLQRWWAGAGAGCSQKSVRRYTKELKDLDLLDYNQMSFQHCSEHGIRSPRHYTYIDIGGLLLLAEMLKERLEAEGIAQPGHQGAFLGMMYDALFSGWGWRRKGDPDMDTPEDYDQSAEVRSMGSHSARADLDEHDPERIGLASALRHLREMTIVFAKNQGKRGHEFMESAKHMALKRCQSDRERISVGELMKDVVRDYWSYTTDRKP